MVASGSRQRSADGTREPVSPEQVRAARAFLGLSQAALAAKVGVRRRVLIDYEGGLSIPHESTMTMIHSVLNGAGIEFISGRDGSVGVWLTRDGLERTRRAALGVVE